MARDERVGCGLGPRHAKGVRSCNPANREVECWNARSDPLTWHARLDLVDLLVGRPVDPGDQRLRGAADRAEADHVVTRLVAGLALVRADVVVAIELARGHLQRRLQGCAQPVAALAQLAAAAVA